MSQRCEVAPWTGGRGALAAASQEPAPQLRITAVEVSSTRITIHVNGGVALDWPLRRVPVVAHALPEARQRWELTPDGTGINWPDLFRPRPDGLLNVWEVLQERLHDEARSRGLAVDWDLAGMSAEDAELVALWRLNADLVQGSYLQFRCAWDALTASYARRALIGVGAPRLARLLDAMEELGEAFALPREVADRPYLPSLMPRADFDRLQDLEAAFWELAATLPRLVVAHHLGSLAA